MEQAQSVPVYPQPIVVLANRPHEPEGGRPDGPAT